MSRALQINSSPQGWMARNTKPVPLAEKGWAITMKKISIILLSAVLVFSMAACNGGKEKADNQTEKQTESVKPTEEAEMATEAVTEVTTEAGSEETEKDIAEVKDSEEKNDKEDNRSADNETASRQEEKPKQNDEPEQKASVNDNEEAGGNQSNAGNGGQTTDSPKDNVSNPQPASVAYSPQNVDAEAHRSDPKDFNDYNEYQSKYESLKADEKRLDRLFDKTCYGKELIEVATELADRVIAQLGNKELEKVAVTVAEGVREYSTGKRGR